MLETLTVVMFFSRYGVAALAAAFSHFPNVAAVAPTDEYTDADPGQSSYLPNHNMDPAVVDSSQFGQLWKIPFNAKEQVRLSSPYLEHGTITCAFGQPLASTTDKNGSFTQNH